MDDICDRISYLRRIDYATSYELTTDEYCLQTL